MTLDRFLMTAFAAIAIAAPAAQAARPAPSAQNAPAAVQRHQPPAAQHDAYDWGLGALEVFGSFLILGAYAGVRRLNALTREAQDQSLRTS